MEWLYGYLFWGAADETGLVTFTAAAETRDTLTVNYNVGSAVFANVMTLEDFEEYDYNTWTRTVNYDEVLVKVTGAELTTESATVNVGDSYSVVAGPAAMAEANHRNVLFNYWLAIVDGQAIVLEAGDDLVAALNARGIDAFTLGEIELTGMWGIAIPVKYLTYVYDIEGDMVMDEGNHRAMTKSLNMTDYVTAYQIAKQGGLSFPQINAPKGKDGTFLRWRLDIPTLAEMAMQYDPYTDRHIDDEEDMLAYTWNTAMSYYKSYNIEELLDLIYEQMEIPENERYGVEDIYLSFSADKTLEEQLFDSVWELVDNFLPVVGLAYYWGYYVWHDLEAVERIPENALETSPFKELVFKDSGTGLDAIDDDASVFAEYDRDKEEFVDGMTWLEVMVAMYKHDNPGKSLRSFANDEIDYWLPTGINAAKEAAMQEEGITVPTDLSSIKSLSDAFMVVAATAMSEYSEYRTTGKFTDVRTTEEINIPTVRSAKANYTDNISYLFFHVFESAMNLYMPTKGYLPLVAEWVEGEASVTTNGKTTVYATLEEAIAAAKSDSVIKLLADVDTVELNKTVTFDLNGHVVNGEFKAANDSEITLRDTAGNGSVTGNLKANGGAVITVESGTFRGGFSTARDFELVVKGGTFYTDPADPVDYVAEGYEAVEGKDENDETIYVVGPAAPIIPAKKSLEDLEVNPANGTEFDYTGEVLDVVSVKDGDYTLILNVDYIVTYLNGGPATEPKEAGAYTAIITGIGENYEGTVYRSFKIVKDEPTPEPPAPESKDISNYLVTPENGGSGRTMPTVTVRKDVYSELMVEGQDYEVRYVTSDGTVLNEKPTGIGGYQIIVTGIGEYSGTVNHVYTIIDPNNNTPINNYYDYTTVISGGGSGTTNIEDEEVPLGGTHEAYIKGMPDGTFNPYGNLSRAEAATIMANISDDFVDSKVYDVSKFSDVKADDWFVTYVGYAAESGIIGGYTNGTFCPLAEITRAEFSVMIVRYLGLSLNNSTSFSDTEGHWAKGYIAALQAAGIAKGYEDGTYHPDDNITRAEAVTMINNALGRIFAEEYSADELMLLEMDNPFSDVSSDDWFFLQVMEASVGHMAGQICIDPDAEAEAEQA